MTSRNHKKNLIISYKNLTDDLKELFKNAYPEGYSDFLQKTIKPNGEPIFTVPLETDDTNYLIKFDVKIDTSLVEQDDRDDLDDDFIDDEKGDDTEFSPLSEVLDKEEGIQRHDVVMRHGCLEDMEILTKNKAAFESVAAEIADDFGTDDEESFDSYIDEDTGEKTDIDDDDDEEEEEGPTDDELLDIENTLDSIDLPTDGSLLRGPDEDPLPPAKPKRGRPSKAMLAARAAKPEPVKPKATRGRPRKNPSQK